MHIAEIVDILKSHSNLDNVAGMARFGINPRVVDFDSWDVCDQVCCNLFDRTDLAWAKAVEWSRRSKEFVSRAGFALMAGRAWHRKDAGDELFVPFFECIRFAAGDERNYVKKAVNWALRQIGKRNPDLRMQAIHCAGMLLESPEKSAKWIARDALRELEKRTG